MGKLRRRKILTWIFGIILGVGTAGFVGTLVLSYDLIQNPKDEFPPEMLILSTFGFMLTISSFVLIGLFLTMKKHF